jgi:hypothetical protein
MMHRSRFPHRQLGCCVDWRAAVAESPTAVDIARRLGDALAHEGMPYAIGGALALAYYATPRATVDVDINVPAIPFYAEMASRTRQVPLLGRPIDILNPQDLVTLKMMFFRRKDLADVEAVLRHPPPGLDARWVRSKLVDMVGETDERIREWDSIVSDVSAAK